jgi:hypothetical protein
MNSAAARIPDFSFIIFNEYIPLLIIIQARSGKKTYAGSLASANDALRHKTGM